MKMTFPSLPVFLACALFAAASGCSTTRDSDWSASDAPKSYVEFTVTGNPDLTFWIRESTYGSAQRETTVNRHATRKIALSAGTHVFAVEAGSGVKTISVDTVEGMITPVVVSVWETSVKEVPHVIPLDTEYYRPTPQVRFNYKLLAGPPQLPYHPL
jgi:hypothetical protein